MRNPDPARAGMPCHRLQRFLTRMSAEAYAAHNDRRRIAIECSCGGYHVRAPTKAELAAQEKRREAERVARLARYHATVPERGRER